MFWGGPERGAIGYVRAMAGRLAPELSAESFRVEGVEGMSFADGFADVVICNAVLHFAKDDAQFRGDGGGVLAGAAAGWDAVLPAGFYDWGGILSGCGTAVFDVGRGGVVPGG